MASTLPNNPSLDRLRDGVLAGIGFTMSLFIAGEAFPDPADYAAAKIAIFLASLIAGVVGAVILYPRSDEE